MKDKLNDANESLGKNKSNRRGRPPKKTSNGGASNSNNSDDDVIPSSLLSFDGDDDLLSSLGDDEMEPDFAELARLEKNLSSLPDDFDMDLLVESDGNLSHEEEMAESLMPVSEASKFKPRGQKGRPGQVADVNIEELKAALQELDDSDDLFEKIVNAQVDTVVSDKKKTKVSKKKKIIKKEEDYSEDDSIGIMDDSYDPFIEDRKGKRRKKLKVVGKEDESTTSVSETNILDDDVIESEEEVVDEEDIVEEEDIKKSRKKKKLRVEDDEEDEDDDELDEVKEYLKKRPFDLLDESRLDLPYYLE